jgi:hypothetical protein
VYRDRYTVAPSDQISTRSPEKVDTAAAMRPTAPDAVTIVVAADHDAPLSTEVRRRMETSSAAT